MEQVEDLKILRIARMIQFLVKKCTECKHTIDTTTQFNLGVLRQGYNRLYGLFNLDSIPDGRLVDYVVYQLYRYRDLIAEYPNGKFRATWLWSENAISKYHKQFIGPEAKPGINYYIDQWLTEGGLTRDYLVNVLEAGNIHPMSKYLFMASEENTKRRFFNTDVGMLGCFSSTTGWSPFSPTCQQCKYTARCIEYFKNTIPEIIRLRQEAKRN